MPRPIQFHKPTLSPAALRLGILAIAALAVQGCAARGHYPSLARRPAESAYGSGATAPQPAPAPAPSAASPALLARLATLRDSAAKAHRDFEALRPAGERAAALAAGAAPGAENWSVAQGALAALDSARSSLLLPLADLDTMLVEATRAAVDGPDADLRAVRKVRDEVDGWLADENRSLDSLRGRVRG